MIYYYILLELFLPHVFTHHTCSPHVVQLDLLAAAVFKAKLNTNPKLPIIPYHHCFYP